MILNTSRTSSYYPEGDLTLYLHTGLLWAEVHRSKPNLAIERQHPCYSLRAQKGLGNNEACAKFAEFCTLNPSIVVEITTYNLCHNKLQRILCYKEPDLCFYLMNCSVILCYKNKTWQMRRRIYLPTLWERGVKRTTWHPPTKWYFMRPRIFQQFIWVCKLWEDDTNLFRQFNPGNPTIQGNHNHR